MSLQACGCLKTSSQGFWCSKPNCPCSHPLQICDPWRLHPLINEFSVVTANDPRRPRRKLHCQK